MIAQGFVIQNNSVLMVRQYVERGDIVWNFPGGGIEKGETPEQACIREVKEETGYDVKIKKLLMNDSNKFTYIVEIVGGELILDKNLEDNDDIIDVSWISINDKEKWDHITIRILDLYQESVKLEQSAPELI